MCPSELSNFNQQSVSCFSGFPLKSHIFNKTSLNSSPACESKHSQASSSDFTQLTRAKLLISSKHCRFKRSRAGARLKETSAYLLLVGRADVEAGHHDGRPRHQVEFGVRGAVVRRPVNKREANL